MSKKHRRRSAEAERLKQRIETGRFLPGGELPEGAIAADPSQQNPTIPLPPLYYIDRPFVCKDCGMDQVWSAEQQKWYYEVAKGSIYSRAIRCRQCRKIYESLKGIANPE